MRKHLEDMLDQGINESLDVGNSQYGMVPYLCIKKWYCPIERVFEKWGFCDKCDLYARKRRRDRNHQGIHIQEAGRKGKIMRKTLVEGLSDEEKKRLISDVLSGGLRERTSGYLLKKEAIALMCVSKQMIISQQNRSTQ